MLFNSFTFAVFLPITFILYWILPHKYRWILLLIASYYFYMSWDVKYIVLILSTTIISYMCAIFIERTNNKSKKKMYLLITLLACLGVLFFFKYFNFFSKSLSDMLKAFSIQTHPVVLKLMLPIGISFYTFQMLSYVVDVYKGGKAEHHFGKYATFISFFPQLVAGPIERASNLLPQIKKEQQFDYHKATYGLKLMAWGFFKKMVIADRLAVYVDNVYGNLGNYKGLSLVIATVFFAFQIYCDFSGYSDIAIGTAKLFGIDFMVNFRSPYFSASIKEFWSRWHISLSTFFRDYVYIPLGGNRCSKVRHFCNLLATFLISGLWHGADWTFVIWGGLHGAAQGLETSITRGGGYDKVKYNLKWWCSVFCVFIFCNLAWIFFRANSLKDALYVYRNLFVGISQPFAYIKMGFQDLQMGKLRLLWLTVLMMILFIYDLMARNQNIITRIEKKPFIFRWVVYLAFTVLVILFSQKGVPTEFVYFQF